MTLTLIAIASAAVVDRIAVVVGKTVITESEVIEEVRMTDFLNRRPLDLSPAARRAAAERLVDQQLIRTEMTTGSYPMPSDSEAAEMFASFRKENYPDDARFREALQKYGLTEEVVKQHLRWQVATLKFTEMRFPSGPFAAPLESADRSREAASDGTPEGPDGRLEAWLKETRSNTRVQFKPEAFQ
jgi:hypothetical protein